MIRTGRQRAQTLPHPSELRVHIACMYWLRMQHPNIYAYHTPNGEIRVGSDGSKLKAMGVLPGHPDINLDEPRGEFHGARIELKKHGEYPDATQRQRLRALQSRGYFVCVIKSFDAFQAVVTWYLSGAVGECPVALPEWLA